MSARLVLGFLEIRQDVIKTPARVAKLAPAIVILVLATDIKQAVDRTRSAQHLAAGLEHRPPVKSRLGFGLVHPVDGFFLEQPGIAERNMDPDMAVLWPRFEQPHRIFSVRSYAVGEYASGRSGADDDLLEFHYSITGMHQRP